MKWQVNDMKTVSVIMPVYNTEKYLSEAIESVLNQTYSDFELLLINDRSTDNSKQICIDYSKKDNRIRFFDNNTGEHGPGPTRNIGLDNAKGEYVYFMDSDDWIDKELLTDTVTKAEETGAYIVQFGAVYEHENGKSDLYVWSGKELMTKKEIYSDFLNHWNLSRFSLWNHLFRARTVKCNRFENMQLAEDISFVLDAYQKMKRIVYLKKPYYHYRFVSNSISHQWNDKIIEYRMGLWDHQLKYMNSFEKKISKEMMAGVVCKSYLWIVYLLSIPECTVTYHEKRKILKNVKKKIDLDEYKNMISLSNYHGVEKLKYYLIKMGLEQFIVLFGPIYLQILR